MPGKHALLSPSAAHRWLNCTAAPLLEKDIEDKGSTFAEEGSLAHAYCAKKLKEYLGRDVSEELAEIDRLNDKYHCGEMDEHTDSYAAIVREKFEKAKERVKDAQLLVETRLDFSEFVPEAFGTSDAIIIADDVMEVIDFKYGKGVEVSAEENPQMMIYALGAYAKFGFDYDIERVRMTIVQPRLGNLSEYEMTAENLENWAKTVLTPKAKEAYNGGEQKPGEWCRFCKIKATCKALAKHCTEVAEAAQDPRLISPQDMAKNVLPILPTIKTWLTGVEEYSLEQALAGVKYDGYKLVEGRSIRKITDAEDVVDALTEEGFAEEAFIKPKELRSITELEKNVGKKLFGTLCGEFIQKPQGKPTLVPESDKRPTFDPVKNEFESFAEESASTNDTTSKTSKKAKK